MLGKDYASESVNGTPGDQRLWEQVKRKIAEMPRGAVVEIRFDWTE